MPGQPALLIPLLFLLSDSQNHQPDLSDTALSLFRSKLSLPPDLLNMSHAILQISVLHVQWNLRFEAIPSHQILCTQPGKRSGSPAHHRLQLQPF